MQARMSTNIALMLWGLLLSAPVLRADTTSSTIALVEDGRTRAVIVLDGNAGPLAKKAAELLQSRIEQRTGTRLSIRSEGDLSEGTSRIVIVAPGSQLPPALSKQRQTPSTDELGEEGFFIETVGPDIYLLAREGRGMIYAVGKLLHTATSLGNSMFAAPPQGLERPLMRDRFLHLTPHYHTFFEVKDAATIAPIVEELALWGLNGLSMEIEEAEYNDPFDHSVTNADGRQVWAKAKQLWKIGQGLGLKLGLVDSANDPYQNQVTPRIVAEGGLKYLDKPLANPMVPEARALLLRNKENMYRDLQQSGIQLDNVLWFPYDTGGCFSDTCKPWMSKFLELTEELGTGLKKHNPKARVFITDWLASDEEGETIVDYLNHHRATKIDGVWKQDRTTVGRFDQLDKRFAVMVFLDLSVAGFGTIGAQPLPTMIDSFVGDGARRGMSGVMVYTEGIWDDFNKALGLQMAWNPAMSAEDFSQQYASYFFDSAIASSFHPIVQQSEKSWPDARMPLDNFSHFAFIDTQVSAGRLEDLTLSFANKLRPERRGLWRWQVLEYRARIGKVAASLRSASGFKGLELQAINAGVDPARLRLRIKEKRDLLERYRTLVDELRTKVYQEPADRMFSMHTEDDYMIQAISVPSVEWSQVLKEMDAKLATSEGQTK